MSQDNLPIPLSELPFEVHRFVGASSPRAMRQMAARALAPLGPGHLLTALYVLCFDSDPEVVATAQQSLGQIPDEVLKPALDEALPAAVLDYLARALAGVPEYLEQLLLNRAVPATTVEWVATWADDRPLEIIAANQERLLRHPPIVEALYFNPQTRQSTLDRVLEHAVRAGLDLPRIPALREIALALGLRSEEAGEGEVEASGAARPEEDGSFGQVLRDSVAEAEADDATLQKGRAGARRPAPEKKDSREKPKYATLTASQKIRLALLGSQTDRGQLVRDAKRIVAMAAIKSPKVNVNEAEHYASNSALHQDVIRYIANNRQWTRSYRMKLLLLMNPKCPVPNALTFLQHLRKSDLRSIAVNRNVPEVVATTARNLMKARSGADKGGRGR